MKNDSSDSVIAVMQPYFFPYVGYWQLMAGVDIFVVHKNVKYVKQSWINRNRILLDGQPSWLTIPLVGAPDSALISEKRIGPQWRENLIGTRRKLEFAYGWSNHFSAVMDWLMPVLETPTESLYDFLINSLRETHSALNLESEIVFEDDLTDVIGLAGKNRLLEMCRQTKANRYVNLPGGQRLYSQEDFDSVDVKLHFHDPQLAPYSQNVEDFVPGLSLLDILFSVGFLEAKKKIQEERWTLGAP